MYDVVFRNARVIDGSGARGYEADVALSGDRIARIGNYLPEPATIEIDAGGKILCPGFVDAHSHADRAALFVANPDAKVLQGVTTEVAGNCGQSPAPISKAHYDDLLPYLAASIPSSIPMEPSWQTVGEMLDLLDRRGHITDLVQLVGHGTLRVAAMGTDDRAPTASEMVLMKDYVEEAMTSGAAGLSTGLIFPPGCYASTDEITELCRVVAKYDGIYTSHIRGEAGSLLDAVREAIEIARKSGCRLHISHHKVMRRYRGWSEKTLKMMEDAIKEGIDVTCDVYPYAAGSNAITSLLPPWANAGGVPKVLERLSDASERKRILEDFKRDLPGWDNHAKDTGWDRILIGSCRSDKSIVGLSLQEIADSRGVAPEIGYLDLVASEKAQATIVILSHSEEDMERIMKHHLSMIGSDALPSSLTGPLASGNPHPRSFGTYPRVLGRYVREKGFFTWEEAIRKMTGYPAIRFRLKDRGRIEEGLLADLVLFDPNTVIDRAEYRNSRVPSEGVERVVKNGQFVVVDGKTTGKILGRSIRIHPA
ncbi:MAG: D-aminoacylase [Synergistaceae bacterium]|jgi:N-acyl-D-amino-acid deacylase|nr:D-aminoacylase [Synergistaceae bacterium]